MGISSIRRIVQLAGRYMDFGLYKQMKHFEHLIVDLSRKWRVRMPYVMSTIRAISHEKYE